MFCVWFSTVLLPHNVMMKYVRELTMLRPICGQSNVSAGQKGCGVEGQVLAHPKRFCQSQHLHDQLMPVAILKGMQHKIKLLLKSKLK